VVIEVGETHSTLTISYFYRSPTLDQTWIGSAAAVLDAAALFNSVVDLTPSPTAGLCIAPAGSTFDGSLTISRSVIPQGESQEPIAISRERVRHRSSSSRARRCSIDRRRDAGWRDFVGWRANYDHIIEASYKLFNCPRTDWRSASNEPLVERSNVRGQNVED